MRRNRRSRSWFHPFLQILLLGIGVIVAGCSTPAVPAAPAPAAPQPVRQASAPAHRPIPDRIVIPAIGVDTPVVELGWHPARSDEGAIFSEWDVAKYAAGWHKNSAVPGEGGNVVLSGHNNILGAVFRELDLLRKGDEIVLWSGEEQFVYSVSQVVIVPEKHASPEQRAKNARWIGPFDDDRLTLVSCWPRNDNTHRIIVVAHPIQPGQTAAP